MAHRWRLALCETCEWNPDGHAVLNPKTTNMPRLATILIALMGSASLWIAPLAFAFAQPNDRYAPSVSESDGIPGPPAPVAGDLAGPPTSATDGSSGTADDSSGPPASHSDWEQVPEINSDATSDGDGQVLEVPQSVNPDQATAPNGDDNSPPQASNDGQHDKLGNDELGGLNDYQQNENADLPGGYYIPVPVPVPVGPGFPGTLMGGPVQSTAPGMGGVGSISPPFPGGGFRPTPPIILRPGGLAGIPSTSPMLTPPIGSAAMPGDGRHSERIRHVFSAPRSSGPA
jgi:hypothetical protein